MSRDSAIAWTHHTFNPWWGCTKTSPGCANCYAGTWAKRTGHACFGDAPRRLFKPGHWAEPKRWAREAQAAGKRARVFCASMADLLDDRRELDGERAKLWALVRETADALDWLFLTKRPDGAKRLVAPDIFGLSWWGVTAEDQARADERIPFLLELPPRVRFLSVEPMLEPVDLSAFVGGPHVGLPGDAIHDGYNFGLSWIIIGGESGPKARPFRIEWAQALLAQCRAAGVPAFFKQTGAEPIDWVRPKDRAGREPSEWPAYLRVQELPAVRP